MDSQLSPRAMLRSAHEKVQKGQLGAAADLIQEAIVASQHDAAICGDAVNILMLGRLFDAAERVFLEYEAKRGKRLRADFSIGDIRRERSQSVRSANTFRRLTIRERGHFTNVLTLAPIKEITLDDVGITLKLRRGSFWLPWADITEARVTERHFAKAYGKYARSYFTQRTVTLRGRDRTFRFDASDQFPDFERSDELLRRLLLKLPNATVVAAS